MTKGQQPNDKPLIIPQPIRSDGAGGPDLGPRDVMRDIQNPDMLVPPATDNGLLPNLRMSFSDTHMQLNHGGGHVKLPYGIFLLPRHWLV